MNLLLDTHVLIRWVEGSRRVGPRTRKAVERPGASVWMSAASVWEIAIKSSAGSLRLKQPLEEIIVNLLDRGFRSLPVNVEHALAVRDLPGHHVDPFDRILIAQARSEDLTIVTVDSAIEAYDVRTMDASE